MSNQQYKSPHFKEVLKDRLAKRRYLLATLREKKELSIKHFDVLTKDLSTDPSYEEELKKARAAFQFGMVQPEPDLSTPENQFIWGLFFAIADNEPNTMKNWRSLNPNDEEISIDNSIIWQQINDTKAVKREKYNTVLKTDVQTRTNNNKIKTGASYKGTHYLPTQQLLVFDVTEALIHSFEIYRSHTTAQISKAILSKQYPLKMQTLSQTVKKIKQQQNEYKKKHKKLPKEKLRQLNKASVEWHLYRMFFETADSITHHKEATDMSSILLQDLSTCFNFFASSYYKAGPAPIKAEQYRQSFDENPVHEFIHLCRFIQFTFFETNDFLHGEADYRQIGIDPSSIRRRPRQGHALPNAQDYKELQKRLLELQVLKPNILEKKTNRALYDEKIKSYNQKRIEIIQLLWRDYAEHLALKIVQEQQEKLEEEMDQSQDNDDSQDADSNDESQDGDGQEGESDDSNGDGSENDNSSPSNSQSSSSGQGQKSDSQDSSAPQQQDQDGQKSDQQNNNNDPQDQQNQDQSQEQNDPQNGEDGSEQDSSEQSQEQNGDENQTDDDNSSQDGQDQDAEGSEQNNQDSDGQEGQKSDQQNGEEGEGQGKNDDDLPFEHRNKDEQIDVEDSGQLDDIDEVGETPEEQAEKDSGQEGESDGDGQDADSQGQDGQDQDGQTADQLQQDMNDEGDDGDGQDADSQGQDGQEGNDSDQNSKKPQDQSPPSDKGGEDTGNNKVNIVTDWSNYPEQIKKLQGPISRVAEQLKKIKRKQIQQTVSRSRKKTLMPKAGEIDRFNIAAKRDLVLKQKTGQQRTIEDYELFHDDRTKKEETIVEIILLIDGSSSMLCNSRPSRMDVAVTTAAIIYEASRKVGGIRFHLGLWGDENIIWMAKPEDKHADIAKQMEAARQGKNSGTRLNPAIVETAHMYSKHPTKAGDKSGYTHVLVISDGDIMGSDHPAKSIESFMREMQEITFDGAIIKENSSTPTEMEKELRSIKTRNPHQKVTIAKKTDLREMPLAIVDLLCKKIVRSKSFVAVPTSKKRSAAKRAHKKITNK